jgi:hypothetical protein
MTTDRSSPHEQALNLADMMYVGPKRGRLGDRSAGEAAASVARRRPLVVDRPAADRPAEPAAPAAPVTPPEPVAAAPAIDAGQSEASVEAPAAAVEDAPIKRDARPLRLVADAVDDGAGLEDDVLWSQDAASPHDVVAPTPRRRRGLTVGEQRRPWARKRSAPASPPAAQVNEAPELEQLHDVAVDDDEAPIADTASIADRALIGDAAPIAGVVADAPSDEEPEAVSAPAPAVGVRLATTAQGWQRSRARGRLRRQARPTSAKRRKALRGVVVGLVAGALVAVVIVVTMSLGGHAPGASSAPTPAPSPAAIAGSSMPPSTVAAASEADRRERAKRAAEAKREQQRKAERQRQRRERAARKRREARERAARRAGQRATTPSTPAPAAPAPVAPAPAPVAAAAAPTPAPAPAPSSSSSSDRAGWTGEFTP